MGGWPMAELWGQDWFDGYFLADGGRAPSILNGGLLTDVQFPPLPTLFVLGFFAVRPAGAQDARHAQVPDAVRERAQEGFGGPRRGVALGRRGRRGLRPAGAVRPPRQRRRGPLHDAGARAEPRPRGHARRAGVRDVGERDARAGRAAEPFLFGKWYW